MINISETIIYEDNEILICHKESGVAIQTKRLGEQDMESRLCNYLAAKGIKPYIGIVHRLDQPVEGIMVFAKTKAAAANLSRQMQENGFEKYYLAIVQGHPVKRQAELTDYLLRDGRSNVSAVVKKETAGAKKAVLSYEVLAELPEESLVKIKLQTGRHHQIRVQMAHLGYPLAGDHKYGNQTGMIALCAYRIAFCHPLTEKHVSFETLPKGERFKEFLNLQSILSAERT